MQTAQFLAWCPVLFQAARVMRDRGILKELVGNASAATCDRLLADVRG
jgi:hypothetical protein